MSSPEELHVSFRHQGTDYNVDLIKGGKSDHSVEVNGVTYAVLGEREKLDTACKILNSATLDSISSSKDLIDRLSLLEDISFPQAEVTNEVGIQTLNTKAASTPLPTPKTVEQAYEQLTQKLDNYAKQNIGQGALLVQVVGVKGAEKPWLMVNCLSMTLHLWMAAQ